MKLIILLPILFLALCGLQQYLVNSILQSRRPSLFPNKACDKPCFNGGSCIDGACVCPEGWTGPQCDQCFGRIKKRVSTKGFLTDGPLRYSASAKCSWIIENEQPGPLLFKFLEFQTECCWDHLYIYNGDGIDDLIGVFSGNVPNIEVQAKSGRAVVYFSSDLAYNLDGFNISYEQSTCYKNCSNHGQCLSDANCKCDKGFHGEYCQNRLCMNNDEDQIGPCQHGAVCHSGMCACATNFHGDNCQEFVLSPTWDVFAVTDDHLFQPRASHKMVFTPDTKKIWIIDGYVFTKKKDSNKILTLDITQRKFEVVKFEGIQPLPRYDHSVVHRKGKIYLFGGVIQERKITNEFWSFDTVDNIWERITPHNDIISDSAVPIPLAGHTAHIVNDEMHVLFGYNPYEGYVFTTQIFSFKTGKWRKSRPYELVMGRFGHVSATFVDVDGSTKILVHGGYIPPFSGYSSISDEVLLYDPLDHTWSKIASSGIPLFRHSAALIDGIMYIMGGNNHNESTTVRNTNCYSNQIFAFDTICKKFLNISTKEFDLIGRYGHDAISDGKNIFVVGGFDGRTLNDILKFTPANCDSQASSVEECENFANGVRCIYMGKSCSKRLNDVSIRPNLFSLIKEKTFQPGCGFEDINSNNQEGSCGDVGDCTTCISSKNNCGWCDNTQVCVDSNDQCPELSKEMQFSEEGVEQLVSSQSPTESLSPLKNCLAVSQKARKHMTSSISTFGAKRRKTSARLRPCKLATTCHSCKQLKHCSWFVIESRHSKHLCISLEDEELLIKEYNEQREKNTTLSNSSPLNSFAITADGNTESRKVFNSTCSDPCFLHQNCESCIQSSSIQCMWCATIKRCVTTDTYMISFPYGQCQSWLTATNRNLACQMDPTNCSLQKTCSDCQSIGPRCGWCDDGSGTGLGKCIEGTDVGPSEKNSCPISRWYYTGLPACQCNGHSTCTENSTENRKCRNCGNKTRGDHCEVCDLGYFGDPRNGGTCQECRCNGQAKYCNPETGDCYCSTKGVTGPRCDRCEPKYIGDPKSNRICTYELITDFIFTFKLDGEEAKDKYVNQINFFSTPFKRDVEVQFSITCEGESGAKVYINITNMGGLHLRTKPLMASQQCTSNPLKRTYSANEPGFPYGTDTNTTFYVTVNSFITPIKIQISFSQSPPVNWILFFVIFAACFIILLVVAGLLWLIKLRVEWYRDLRRRNDEIEEMASRPLANVNLDFSKNHTNGYLMPISVEPCRDNQTAVYSVVIHLPTGGLPYTPHGASGLAIASILCQLQPPLTTLLQPTGPERNQKRKSALRRFVPFMR